VFALASATITGGMRITFTVATVLIVCAIVTALISTMQARQRKPSAR
jgi:predicted membrane protein